MIPIPFEPELFGFKINIHLVLEYLAYLIAFQYYLRLRKKSDDAISSSNRVSILIGAAIGAFIGSRLIGFLEFPMKISKVNFMSVLQLKSIMGGLFGGLIGVELSKKIIGETESSGDLFTLPIILGIIIGRIGCFLSGTNEFTYGKPTHFVLGMDLGDGISRHPIALYEIVFLIFLFLILKSLICSNQYKNGLIFKLFMISYFGFRFFIEFLKPNEYFIIGLSSIQWLCVICWLYYYKTISSLLIYASKKLYLL